MIGHHQTQQNPGTEEIHPHSSSPMSHGERTTGEGTVPAGRHLEELSGEQQEAAEKTAPG